MTGDAPDSPSDQHRDRLDDLIWWATWSGIVVAGVGLVDGLVMALDKKEGRCPDGKYFPEGTTDLACYAHPQAGIGIAVAAMSVLLAIVVVLASIAARASLRTPGAS